MTLEFGRYLVLSTAHVHCATAQLLDAWALLPATERPLDLASTTFGWFISTREIEPERRPRIPQELLPILAFARERNCGYLLFDCDGPLIPALPEFPW